MGPTDLAEVALAAPLVVECFVATAIFSRGLGRRGGRRSLVALLVCALLCIPVFTLLYARVQGAPFPLPALPWVVLLAMMLLFVHGFFETTLLEALIVATLGYCLDHLCNDLCTLAFLVLPTTGGDRVNMLLPPARYLVVVPAYAAAYLLVGRRFSLDAARTRRRARWVTVCCIALFASIALQIVLVNGRSEQAQLVGFVYDTLCTALIMVAMIGLTKTDHLEDSLETISRLWEQKKAQYELTQENIELINIKCHDIRKRIEETGARSGALSQKTVDEIADCVRVYDASARTGSRALDAVLTDKHLYCSEHGIELTCMVDGSLLANVAEDDLYFLVENILSNAIEAVEGLEVPAQRVISLTIDAAGPMARISEENYFDGDLRFEDGLPVTTKRDSANHGFGMRSIRHVVEKYDGDLVVSARDGVFSLNILLPRP